MLMPRLTSLSTSTGLCYHLMLACLVDVRSITSNTVHKNNVLYSTKMKSKIELQVREAEQMQNKTCRKKRKLLNS
jgi:hypothetical protein